MTNTYTHTHTPLPHTSHSDYLCLFFIPRKELDGEQEGFLAGLKIPAPWTSGKTVESIHPVRDNYKYKETVHIPGARYLYLRFDPRCSSQYDYDKVSLYIALSSLCHTLKRFREIKLEIGLKARE